MSKLPESVTEAVATQPAFDRRDLRQRRAEIAEARARRVILALAENLPDSAVEKARLAYNDTYPGNVAMRAAISAALLHMAKEGE